MPYITSVERHGQVEGKRKALRVIVRARFGEAPEALEKRIAAADETDIDALLERVAQAARIEDI